MSADAEKFWQAVKDGAEIHMHPDTLAEWIAKATEVHLLDGDSVSPWNPSVVIHKNAHLPPGSMFAIPKPKPFVPEFKFRDLEFEREPLFKPRFAYGIVRPSFPGYLFGDAGGGDYRPRLSLQERVRARKRIEKAERKARIKANNAARRKL